MPVPPITEVFATVEVAVTFPPSVRTAPVPREIWLPVMSMASVVATVSDPRLICEAFVSVAFCVAN